MEVGISSSKSGGNSGPVWLEEELDELIRLGLNRASNLLELGINWAINVGVGFFYWAFSFRWDGYQVDFVVRFGVGIGIFVLLGYGYV